jgi:anti-sigma B factor antagonist
MAEDTTRIESHAGSRDGHQVIAIHGPVTVATAPALRKAGEGITGRVLIVDLTAVPHLDSSAIGVLVHFYTTSRESGRKLALVGLSDRVRKTLKNMSVDKLFKIYPVLSDAENDLSERNQE